MQEITQVRIIQQHKYLQQKEQERKEKIREFTNKQLSKNKYDRAASRITGFIRRNYFFPRCVNDSDICKINPFYRFRVSFTNSHLLEYSEENVDDIVAYRKYFSEMSVDRTFVFRMCFDINYLYQNRHMPIEYNNTKYYLQPNDHIRLLKNYAKISNIKYQQEFDYYKSVSIDGYRNHVYIEYNKYFPYLTQQKFRQIIREAIANNNI